MTRLDDSLRSDSTVAATRLRDAIAGSELPKYAYGYPSKRAYRSLDATCSLERLWGEVRGAINLYVHVPFCAYRCSFCTLFLTTNHDDDLRQRYVDALRDQIRMYGSIASDVEVVSLYFGGGTPSSLTASQFEMVFEALHEAFPKWHPRAEIAIEGSPDSLTAELLGALHDLGVNRVSMGLQTLDDDERATVGRPYTTEVLHEAVEAIATTGFDNVNYDLIYGLEGQTRASWLRSLDGTMAFGPDTITLYPVVVRPLTNLARRVEQNADAFMQNQARYSIYDESVGRLAEASFHQNSFVRFSTRPGDGLQQEVADFSGVPLIGMGAGSRSYTDLVHYGTDFAVRQKRSREIISDFIERAPDPRAVPPLGFVLDDDERKRRFCILNLSLGGFEFAAFRSRFGSDARDDFPDEIDALLSERCVEAEDGLRLTPKGFKYSNVIADLFQSNRVSTAEALYVPN